VINALYANVRTFITWPNRQEAEQTMETIENSYGFPDVIGTVDGTHIKITASKDYSESYVNRKGFHSMQLQVRMINIISNISILIYMIFATMNSYVLLIECLKKC